MGFVYIRAETMRIRQMCPWRASDHDWDKTTVIVTHPQHVTPQQNFPMSFPKSGGRNE